MRLHTKPKISQSHECYVPDKHKDFHTQLRCIINDLLRMQREKRGIKWVFTIDGKETKECHLFFPVIFFAGDTMEHNKLSSLQGGTSGNYPCHMCSTMRNDLDSPHPIPLLKMTEGKTIRETWDNNPTTLKSIGYYACVQNSLYETQFCDTMGGLNHALPPDILHAV